MGNIKTFQMYMFYRLQWIGVITNNDKFGIFADSDIDCVGVVAGDDCIGTDCRHVISYK